MYVVIDGVDVRAGTLFPHRRRGTESATFTYDTAYLGTPGAYQLDPELPLRTGAHHTRLGAKMFGAFTDWCPRPLGAHAHQPARGTDGQ